jgi:hypothetical protein
MRSHLIKVKAAKVDSISGFQLYHYSYNPEFIFLTFFQELQSPIVSCLF